LPRIQRSPVFVGTCAQDPALDLDAHLARVKEYGFAGLVNFPSVSFFEGSFRDALEESGFGLDREADMLQRARALGLLTIGFCLRAVDARAFAKAGVDILCLCLGIAEWRTIDLAEHQSALDRAVESIRAMIDAAKSAAPAPCCSPRTPRRCSSGPKPSATSAARRSSASPPPPR